MIIQWAALVTWILPGIIAVTALAKGPPEIEQDYVDHFVAHIGDTVKLYCPINATPKPIIEWYQDDRLIHTTWERFRAKGKFLKIKQVQVPDSGVLVCKGVNGFGSVSVQIQLLVKDPFEEVDNSMNRRFHVPSTIFKSLPGSFPAESGFLDAGSGGSMGMSSSQNSNGHSGTAPVLVRTTVVPGGAIHKQVGDTLKLECLTDAHPPPSIVWYKDGDVFLRNEPSDRNQMNLLMPDLKLSDSGKYACKVRNIWGETNATFPVQVYDELELPEILDDTEKSVTGQLGDSVELFCYTKSLGPTQIQWLKQLQPDEVPRDRSKTVPILDYVFEVLPSKTSQTSLDGLHNTSLSLGPPLRKGDSGRYICLANNPEGHAYKEIFFQVVDPIYQDDVQVQEKDVLPQSWVILVPLLSTAGLVFLLMGTAWLRKQAKSGQSAVKSEVAAAPPGNESYSLGSFVAPGSDGGGEWPTALATVGLKRTALHHLVMDTGVKKPTESQPVETSWVEVTNKANQTPIQWMSYDEPTVSTTEDYPFYSSPRDSGFLSRTSVSSSSPLITTNSQRNLLLMSASGSASLEASPRLGCKGTAAVCLQQNFRTPQLHHRVVLNSGPKQKLYMNLRDVHWRPQLQPLVPHPEFQAMAKGSYTDFGYGVDGSAVCSELYSSPPPSDHFYFKIQDGKTEFI